MLRAALSRVAPDIEPVRSSSNIVEYTRSWGRVTAAEIAVVCDLSFRDAERRLDDLAAAETIQRVDDHYWQAAAPAPYNAAS